MISELLSILFFIILPIGIVCLGIYKCVQLSKSEKRLLDLLNASSGEKE